MLEKFADFDNNPKQFEKAKMLRAITNEELIEYLLE